MKTVVKKLYEAMFLVDSAEASADWEGVNTTIKNVLERAGAEIVSIRKWEERRLAYEINGKSRGAYILCYFRAEGERVREIEKDVQLSERIMRVLILCAEHMSPEDVEKDTPVTLVEKHKQKATRAAAGEAEAERVEPERDEERLGKRESAEESEGKAGEPEVVAKETESEQPEQAEIEDFEEAEKEADTEISS